MKDENLIIAEVRALDRLGLEGLRQEWRRLWGPPPKLRSAGLLRRYLAWHIQAAAFGSLSPQVRQKVQRQTARPTTSAPRSPLLKPGTRLTREWKGVRYEVEVVEGGFRYAGTVHKSLSAVATSIAGSRWNGPRFFGLREVSRP